MWHVSDMTHRMSHDSLNVTWLLECHMTHWICNMTESDMTATWRSQHDAGRTVVWLIHSRDMTHVYMWHDSLNMQHDACIYVTWLIEYATRRIQTCGMTHSYLTHLYIWGACNYVWDCVTWLIHVCAMTHSYVWHDAFICVPWRIHRYEMRATIVTWLTHTCALTHSYVCYDSFIHMGCAQLWWHDSFICVPWLIHMCATREGRQLCVMTRDMTHWYMCHDTSICVSSYICVWSYAWVSSYTCVSSFIFVIIHMSALR